ncbi:hypothetical protein CR513_41262, partial [Mucuna pruriens]
MIFSSEDDYKHALFEVPPMQAIPHQPKILRQSLNIRPCLLKAYTIVVDIGSLLITHNVARVVLIGP